MVRTVLLVILGISGGLALATLFQGNTIETLELPEVATDPRQSLLAVGSAPLEERLTVLEATLEAEIANRVWLQQELLALNEELTELRTQGPQRRGRTNGDADVPDPEEIRARFAERFSNARDTDPNERRLNQLTQAGFSSDRAQQILQRESELRMDALYDQYEASREGASPSTFASLSGSQSQLRQELGDADYERYLQAQGQSTSVAVRQVLASSPGESAGLQPGDQIVSYAGERVFSTSDLNRLTLEGAPGQSVALEVIRDGQPIQIYVPRGPVGITTGRGPQVGGGMGR